MDKIKHYNPVFGVQTIEGKIIEENEKWIILDTGEDHVQIAKINILPLKK